MTAGGTRLPDKLLRGFRAMLVVLTHHPTSLRTTLYYLRAVLNAAIGYQGMHLPFWREQVEEVEKEVRWLIRGREGVPMEVPRCMLQSPTAFYSEEMPRAGEAYMAHTARALNRMCHNQEEVVRKVCYHAVAEVQREENMCPRFVWSRRWRLTAGKREHMWRILQAVLPGEEHLLATNRRCGRGGPLLVLDTNFRGAAHGAVRWVHKEGLSVEVVHVRKKDMKVYQRAGPHHAEFYQDHGVLDWGVYKWMLRRARKHGACEKWEQQARLMWKDLATSGGFANKERRGRGGAKEEGAEALSRGDGENTRPGILVCAPLGSNGPKGRGQSVSGQWYEVQSDMLRRDNIPGG